MHFIFGAGYSAQRFAAHARASGAHVIGTTRSVEKFDGLRAAGIEPLVFGDGADLSPITEALRDTTHLHVSIAPDEAGDPVLREFGHVIAAMPRLRWIGYLSTVGVYGDHAGEWVNEDSECHPVSGRSQARLQAERDWLALAERKGTPCAILRLSGIYGPGRNAFVNLANGTAKRLIKPGQVFNRIHVDDIAGVMELLSGGETGGVFNVTDHLPAPPQDVVTYAAHVMGVEPPPETPFAAAQLSPMARSFYGENKRVSNDRIRAAGYVFRYPDYKAAFDALWRDGNWADGRSRSPIKA